MQIPFDMSYRYFLFFFSTELYGQAPGRGGSPSDGEVPEGPGVEVHGGSAHHEVQAGDPAELCVQAAPGGPVCR